MYHIVKEGLRQRYIGFSIKSNEKNLQIKRTDMIGELKKYCDNHFKKNCREMGIFLTRFDGNKGIIRCSHTDKDITIKILKSINNINSHKVEIITHGTSGTIKKQFKNLIKKTILFL